MKKIRILFAIGLAVLQGLIACKTDDISPQSLSQQAQNLLKVKRLRQVTSLPQSEQINYLKSVEEATQFFLRLERKEFPSMKFSKSQAQLMPPPWASPRAENDMKAHGVFTFPDKTLAEIDFDEKGNISALSINSTAKTNISYEYDFISGYLAITKWGIIAVQKADDLDKFVPAYDYYYAPITRWEASLESGWSRIQHFDVEANLTMEDFGKFEVFYTLILLPVIEPFRPSPERFRDNPTNQIIPIQNN